jgi:hypothetical protein
MDEGLKETKTELKEVKQELQATKQEVKRLTSAEIARDMEREIAGRTITMISTALALVAALFWQTAINDTIKAFIPISGAWEYEVAVALCFTLFAAILIYTLAKSADGFKSSK